MNASELRSQSPLSAFGKTLATVCLIAGLVVPISLGEPSSHPEKLPVLNASDFLPEASLKGPHHAVDSEVHTDGFMAYFVIHSDWGTFRTASVSETRQRIHEIQAVTALREMKRYQVAGKALADGVKQPFLAVKNVVTQPEETVDNLEESVGRWIERGKLSLRKAARKTKKAARKTKEAVEDATEAAKEAYDARRNSDAEPDPEVAPPEEVAEPTLASQSDSYRYQKQVEWTKDQLQRASLRYIGYDKARRHLAHELRVDPYSTNLVLQKELDAMAWAVWVGRMGTGWVIPSSDALGYVLKIDDLVWKAHPKDLEVENRKRMKDMGVRRKTRDAFFDNRFYSPSDHTAVIAALETLEDVVDRDHFFHLAQKVDGRLYAEFYVRTAELVQHVHGQKPLERIVKPTERLVVGLTPSHELILFLAADYLSWTSNVDTLARHVDQQIRKQSFNGDVILWLDGDLSSRAARRLSELGWTIRLKDDD